MSGSFRNFISNKERRKEVAERYPDLVSLTPISKNNVIDIIKELESLYLKGEDKPKSRSKFGVILNKHILTLSVKFPRWYEIDTTLEGVKKKSLDNMLNIMPSNVTFKKEQKWDGVHKRYVFIHSDFGEFTGIPSALMGGSWKKGLSGHPKDRHQYIVKRCGKPVINIDTKEIYLSMSLAGKSSTVSSNTIQRAIQNGDGFAGGYHWAYCDEDGNILDNSTEKE